MKTRLQQLHSYFTKDASEIRELMHPEVHGNRELSLAEATVQPGARTALHRHARTEEIYHVTAGVGTMTLGSEVFTIGAGDTICIPPGAAHCVENTGAAPLKILCACAPAYSHDDTELIG